MHKVKTILLQLSMMVIVVCVCNSARAQQTVTVTGSVTDSTNNTAIAGASITVKGNTQTGTITNNEGNFNLTVPQGAVLIVSSVNYLTKEVETAPVISFLLRVP